MDHMLFDKMMRKLPDFKGKQRLARLVYSNYLKNAADVSVKGSYGCTYLLPNMIETVGFEIFLNGIYEKDTHEFLLQRIPLDSVFLDLGANIGSVVIPICRKRKDLRVICVEASPWVARYLEKNIELNGLRNIEVINKVALDEDGIELEFFAPTEKYGKGSLTPHYTDTSVRVPAITVDTLLEQRSIARVGFVKIDVQGFESLVFKGAGSLLRPSDAPDILFEFEDWAEGQASGLYAGAAQDVLRSYGYSLYLLAEGGSLELLTQTLTGGSHMLFATKKKP